MKYQDIQIPDVALRNQFIQYWMNSQYQQAFDIITNNPQLDSKAFTQDVFNLIVQSLLIVENLYFVNVEDYLVNELARYNTMIMNFVKRQTWSSTVEYKVGNFVTYNNEIYLCIQSNTNVLPTDTFYWVYLGLMGGQGGATLDTKLKYEWKANIGYAVKDVVYYKDKLYVALQPNTAKPPDTNPTYWNVFLTIPRAKIITSVSAPTGRFLTDDVIWNRIII